MPAVSTAGLKIPVPLVSAGLHTPPVSGLLPNKVNKSTLGLSSHKVRAPLLPALGFGLIVTVTVVLCAIQGGVPFTVYVYVPAKSVSGSNNPVPLASVGLHVPPTSGVPPKAVNKSVGRPFSQKEIAPGVPGLGVGVTLTVTLAVLSKQGGVPIIV